MEETCNCPILEDCTVYVNDISHNEIIGLSYRNLYCRQVNKKYKMCKRYIAFRKTGKQAPRNVLPNSCMKIEELAW